MDAIRLQELRDRAADLDADLARDAFLAEEAVDQRFEESDHAAVAAENLESFQPAHAVEHARVRATPTEAAPNLTGKGDVLPEDDVEIAWGRVLLACACGLLCAAAACRRLPACRKRRVKLAKFDV